jgi:hypothetical protein
MAVDGVVTRAGPVTTAPGLLTRLAEVGCVVADPGGERQRGAAQDLGDRVGGQAGRQRGHAPAVPQDALDDRAGQLGCR